MFCSKCEAPFVLVEMRKMFVFLVAVTVMAAFVLAAKPTRESELSTGTTKYMNMYCLLKSNYLCGLLWVFAF